MNECNVEIPCPKEMRRLSEANRISKSKESIDKINEQIYLAVAEGKSKIEIYIDSAIIQDIIGVYKKEGYTVSKLSSGDFKICW